MIAEQFTFTSNKPNCPVTTFKLYRDSTLTTEYTGTEIQLLGATSDTLELVVNTRKPWDAKLYIGASSGSGNKSPALEVDIWICGYEVVSLAPNKVPIRISGLQNAGMKFKKESFFESYFTTNHTLCPITHYGITYEEEFPEAVNYTTVIDDLIYQSDTEYILASPLLGILSEDLATFTSYKTMLEAKAGKVFTVFEPVKYVREGVSSRLLYIKYKVD